MGDPVCDWARLACGLCAMMSGGWGAKNVFVNYQKCGCQHVMTQMNESYHTFRKSWPECATLTRNSYLLVHLANSMTTGQ